MPFEATIGEFAAALRDPTRPPPPGVRGRLETPDFRRFSVYRNNIAVGLIGALEARYPVTQRILGAEAFRTMARAFARERTPRSPVMIAYGDDFPDFLEDAAGAFGLPSLPDVARLENAWIEAYHAEEAVVIGLADLAAHPPAALLTARVEFHPAARLLRFATPAGSIWASHQADAGPAAAPAGRGEDVLIARPEADVGVRILPPEAYAFATRLISGTTLARGGRRPRRRGKLRNPSRRPRRGRRHLLDRSRRSAVSFPVAAGFEPASSNPIARFTNRLFGFVPASLAMLILGSPWRVRSSPRGSRAGTAGSPSPSGPKPCSPTTIDCISSVSEIPFPQPELVATLASTAEIVLPILLAFGFLTRYAALGLLA